ncbi:MAG: xanthine dehydrogenase accessory protein XdhC [Pseudomonadota bacterium]
MRSSNTHWSEWVRSCELQGHAYVLITVLGARGSTPRDSGTKMLVSNGREDSSGIVSTVYGTIGGGRLEYLALQKAATCLSNPHGGQWVENFPLGEKLGQCCGGSVTLLFELFVPCYPQILLFGAGHVGRALAQVLASLPIRLKWIDSRFDEFPESIPDNVVKVCTDDPIAELSAASAGSFYIVMTHEHPLDFALAETALKREDAAYVGVIGSERKAQRFRMRLEHRGFSTAQIAQMRCPIGLPEVRGKQPAEIAVSVAGEVIVAYQKYIDHSGVASAAPRWKELQTLLQTSESTLAESDLPVDTNS